MKIVLCHLHVCGALLLFFFFSRWHLHVKLCVNLQFQFGFCCYLLCFLLWKRGTCFNNCLSKGKLLNWLAALFGESMGSRWQRVIQHVKTQTAVNALHFCVLCFHVLISKHMLRGDVTFLLAGKKKLTFPTADNCLICSILFFILIQLYVIKEPQTLFNQHRN